jgi:flagellar motor protein MotB
MDLRLGRSDTEGTPWSVLSDLAITIVLVLVLYIVLQFIKTFRESFINAELARRQDSVRVLVRAAAPRDSQLKVDSLAPDRQRITFSTELLFETCRATLKPEGADLLRQVGRVLGERAGYFEAVQVEGHTDRRPIRGQGVDCPYASNWELSSARATRVVTLFSGESLIANELLSATGRSEYHPVDSTALDPNRRIELLLLYDRRSVSRALDEAR